MSIYRLFEICFHFAGHRSSTQEFSAGPSLVNFSKFEGIPSWIWLLFFGAWFQLFGLFWMVTGLPIFRPLPVLMKLDTNNIPKVIRLSQSPVQFP
jgi:hypothetical protein